MNARLTSILLVLSLTAVLGCKENPADQLKREWNERAVPLPQQQPLFLPQTQRPNLDGPATPELIVQIWQYAAEEVRVPAASIDAVTALLQQNLKPTLRDFNPGELTEFETSLKRFLENEAYAFHDHSRGRRQGKEYWIAYCMLTMCDRTELPLDQLDANYMSVIEKAAAMVEQRCADAVPLEQRETLRPMIETAVNIFKDTVQTRVRNYTRDPLFPAFKKLLNDEEIKELLERSPRNLKKTESEMHKPFVDHFRRQLVGYLSNESQMFLVEFCLSTVRPSLKKTEYWGHMLQEASGGGVCDSDPYRWPVYIGFRPTWLILSQSQPAQNGQEQKPNE